MWEIILSFPVLITATLVQISVFGKIHLINGNTDLILLIIIAWGLNDRTKYTWLWTMLGGLIMSFVSALSFYGYMVIYMLIWLLIYFLKKRVWQMPVILMLFTTILGTILESVFTSGTLFLKGANLDLSLAITRISIPSLIMNLVLAVPVYAIINDLANTIYFDEIEA